MSREQPTHNSAIPEVEECDFSEYRQWLVAAEQKSQESFDKTVLSLSGGGLGISFVFLKDVIGSNPVMSPNLLLGAWLCWGSSAIAVLLSFFLSHLALRHAISQVDAGSIFKKSAGGLLSKATAACNVLGAILFFLGVCLITAFASANLSSRETPNVGQEITEPTVEKTYAETPAKANPSPGGQRSEGPNRAQSRLHSG